MILFLPGDKLVHVKVDVLSIRFIIGYQLLVGETSQSVNCHPEELCRFLSSKKPLLIESARLRRSALFKFLHPLFNFSDIFA